LAGHETTSVALQYCIYNLAQNPEYQNRLREDILKQFPNHDLNYDTVKDCYFLNNMIYESMRLFTPIPILPARITTEDIEIEGWVIPKGYRISVCIWKTQHSKEVWGDDAEEFKPDRFNDLTKLQSACFFPFGGGARVCLGQPFSVLEQKLFLIRLLKKYQISWPSESELVIRLALFQPDHEKLKFNFTPLS